MSPKATQILHHKRSLFLMLLCCSLPVRSSFQHTLMLEMAKILLGNYCPQEAIQQAIQSREILQIQISDEETPVRFGAKLLKPPL